MKQWIFMLAIGATFTLASCKDEADLVNPTTEVATETTEIVDASMDSGIAAPPINPDSLPVAARTYITTHYPTWLITKAEKETRNSVVTYEAYITKDSSRKVLVFDVNGAFLGEEIRGARGHHGGRHNGGISLDSLPQAIKTYIATNYVGDTIKRAQRHIKAGVTTYAVMIDNGTRVKVLIFSATGTFIREVSFAPRGRGNHGQISVDSLPQSIPMYITANYAGYTITTASKKRERQSNSFTYEVIITSGSNRKKLIFDATGAFIREG
jgi:hypothetical protein